MIDWIKREAFPFVTAESTRISLARMKENDTFVKNTIALDKAIAGSSLEVNKVAFAHAKDSLVQEDKRTDSIISRGQSLLVAQAFLASVLALAGVMGGRTDLLSGLNVLLPAVIAGFIVVQTFLLTWNALIAVGGVGYPRISSSELVEILHKAAPDTHPENAAVAAMAQRTINIYRICAVTNDGRFQSLLAAQRSLRNSTFSFGALVLVILYFVHTAPPPRSSQAESLDKIERAIADLNTRLDQRATTTARDLGGALAQIKDAVAASNNRALGPTLQDLNATLRDIQARMPAAP